VAITWGNSGEGEFMKAVLWIVVLYEGVVAIAELTAGMASQPSFLQSIATLPSAGSLVSNLGSGSASTSTATIGGVVDLAVAGGVYYFGLR
jgi:hypothetical protein